MFKATILARLRSTYTKFRLLVLALVFLTFYTLYLPQNHISPSSTWHSSVNGKSDNACHGPSGLDRVVITVKTGATEAILKVPTQLRSSLRCAPNVYVFSDLAQNIESLQIHDALDTIPSAVKDGNRDFNIYRKQQELKNEDPTKIVELLHNFRYQDGSDELAAWVLDKYKNNHIVEKSWNYKPDMDWYFHVDADTYVFLPTLALWLQKLDPSEESLIGAESYIVGKRFAHGGSGILLSNAATRSFVITHNGTAAKWDSEMKNNCCGDWVLAQILHDYGMEVKTVTPMLYGEDLGSLSFGTGANKLYHVWCESVTTLHHISPSEAERIGRFEEQRLDVNAPVSFAELFHGLVYETIPSEIRMDWDNSSGDKSIKDISSMEDCISECAKEETCLQLRFNGDECALGTQYVQLGHAHYPKDNNVKQWRSSWNRTRIAEWDSKQKCHEVVFPSLR